MKKAEFYEDNDLQLMLCSALRYALGRHTYMVGLTAAFLRDKLQYLSGKSLSIMHEDLIRYFDFTVPYGQEDDCDIATWRGLIEAVKAEMAKRGLKS